ncbi:MAG: DUF2156 domain-containing protein [Myxococcota bacterium]|nr:DUF2156 domain-containing protein [Myxococcota bacterium]
MPPAGLRTLRNVLGLPAAVRARGRPRGARLAPEDRQISTAHPTGYLALEPGLFSHHHEGDHVHYALSGRTAFAVGVSGIGSQTLSGFLRSRRRQGANRVLLFPLFGADRGAAVEAGFETIRVGQEASLDLRTFSTTGAPMADLRQMLNRAETRYGIHVREEKAEDIVPEASLLHARWLQSRAQSKTMGLLVGSPGFSRPGARRYFASRVHNKLVAFVTVVPGYCGRGAGIDVLARDPEAPAGAMERLLVGVAQQLAGEGLERLSLGCVPLRGVGANDHPLLGRIMKQLHDGRFGNLLFPFRGLGHFKAKFQPDWCSVYLGAWPQVDVLTLYDGCSLWGLFR